MVSDHSPHHFEVRFFSLATNFQIWRPEMVNYFQIFGMEIMVNYFQILLINVTFYF